MTAPRGEVFDLGYQKYTGVREGRRRAIYSVWRDGIRSTLGLGRGGWQLFLPWFFIFITLAPAVFVVVITSFASQFGGAEDGLEGFRSKDYYAFSFFTLFMFAAIVAPGLLCPDRRERSIVLYLVRPLTSIDYATARWAAFLAVSLAVAYAPQILVYVTFVLSAANPLDYLREHWLLIPRIAAAGAVIALFSTTVAMAVASFTDRRQFASAAVVGLWGILGALGEIGNKAVAGRVGEWIQLVNTAELYDGVNDAIFGVFSKDIPATAYLAGFLGLTAAAGAVLFYRYRSLDL